MSEFVLLYRRPAQFQASPQQLQAAMERWQSWLKDLEQQGHLASFGQPLDMTGGAVVTSSKGTFNDGPYAETKDIVGGYSVITARDLQHAIALTNGHPIFELGGLIEVRPVLRM